jgi:hypothetical protein
MLEQRPNSAGWKEEVAKALAATGPRLCVFRLAACLLGWTMLACASIPSAAHAQVDCARFSQVREWTVTFSLTGNGDGTSEFDEDKTVTIQHSANGSLKFGRFNNTCTGGAPPIGDTSFEVSIKDKFEERFTVNTFVSSARITALLPPAFFIYPSSGTYSLLVGGWMPATMTELDKGDGSTRSHESAAPLGPLSGPDGSVSPGYWTPIINVPLPESGTTLTGNLQYQTPARAADGTLSFYQIPVNWSVSWTIKPKPNALRAVPQATSPVERATVVSFDGTASTGDITTYLWTLKPVDCPQGGETVELQGARQQVMLLCSVAATLKVSDGTNADEKTINVRVVPRRNWKVDFKHNERTGKVRLSFREPVFAFGSNVCDVEPVEHPDNSKLDTVHWNHARIRWWSEGAGYTLKKVEDDGPFKSLWYVAENHLRVHRRTLINSRLLPDGDIYEDNVLAGNKRIMDLLGEAVLAHERMHSTLMQEILNREKALDIVKRIEALYGSGEPEVKDKADFEVGELHTMLSETACAEDKIERRLKRIPKFRVGGEVLADNGERFRFNSLAGIKSRCPPL